MNKCISFICILLYRKDLIETFFTVKASPLISVKVIIKY